ncbi:FtsX-like permease family protein [Companilactobacillus allii]|uniref:Peptide ABC transporter permease n=1 Tax=Companilactobacillus allii TaxID=1847728 RepID=A0A1P8Q1G1_9LACO|nr:FtsX-like permease family protein [Companilactobacillus allii]APX71665.1 peptide ABC transporter permease [Companilactobacillus allii]USQ68751.1 FtsX-like permease family protein [Companilactobacillus allii]
MLNKLALSGIRHRLRDYTVLFSGLMIASAIFYMFLSLAINKSFLSSNSPAAATAFIFGFGIILLAIITIVYINYANTFLLSMRQKEYGMFMMLGAKSSKISKMIFVETFAIGAISTIIGSVIGIIATKFVSQWMIDALDMQVKHFDSFYLPALMWTFVFFIVIFIFSAIKNSISLRRTKILVLLHKDSQPSKIKNNGLVKSIQAVVGIILLAIGYYAMWVVGQNALLIYIGIPVALVTIVGGTYFTITAAITAVIAMLKRNTKFSQRGLNNFTLSQLSFRIGDYTKILSMVSIMFALALGAITVGLGFQNQIDTVVNGQSYYDVTVHNADTAQQNRINHLSGDEQTNYSYKSDDKNKVVYYRASEFKKQPLHYEKFNMNNMISTTKKSSNIKIPDVSYTLQQNMLPQYRMSKAEAVSDAEFNKIAGKSNTLTLVKTDSFKKNLSKIKVISKAENKRFKELKQGSEDKYSSYVIVNGFFSGLEFMGFFLGIAFLAMLASCLMFKILSGASGDVKRYNMLYKIGTKQKMLRSTINKEIAVLFAVPAGLGIIHVLLGLQMFTNILYKPYMNIEIPFGIFIVLYLGYYLLTRYLYKKIVLK